MLIGMLFIWIVDTNAEHEYLLLFLTSWSEATMM